ncbi:polymorphic toxin-type HINT domain-containing protein [uncultured Microscilla sp.]|uniref:polymorphic toxin-type HINT domain-containing protein n=1 Tax=uncultured Microscilla sp. TaxID=432653 RepID=UPI00261377AC|nr:polymorphic toxin-type HINT domain-containing protein [uncultured Microscilla sp.]
MAGTKVWLRGYHLKNIEDVLPEDTVITFDAITKQEVLGRITHTIIKQSSTLIGVYTVADTLWVTPEHPFYVNGRWVPAGDLKKGDQLALLNHRQLLARKTRHLPRSAQVRIDNIVVKDTVATVYNFTVAKYHNYYVGNVGVLVHNNECREPFYILTEASDGHKEVMKDFNSLTQELKYVKIGKVAVQSDVIKATDPKKPMPMDEWLKPVAKTIKKSYSCGGKIYYHTDLIDDFRALYDPQHPFFAGSSMTELRYLADNELIAKGAVEFRGGSQPLPASKVQEIQDAINKYQKYVKDKGRRSFKGAYGIHF